MVLAERNSLIARIPAGEGWPAVPPGPGQRVTDPPLVMDFADPTPARGLFGHWAIAAADRFHCEMVLALDLVHHMVFGKHLDFAHIAGGLAQFSKRWLVVEFAPVKIPNSPSRPGTGVHGIPSTNYARSSSPFGLPCLWTRG
jgi:hypothetical protein